MDDVMIMSETEVSPLSEEKKVLLVDYFQRQGRFHPHFWCWQRRRPHPRYGRWRG